MISSGEETLGVAKGPGEAAGHRFIWTMEDAFLEEASREDHPLHDIMVASQVPSLSCSLHKGRDPTYGFERGVCIKHWLQKLAYNSHNPVPVYTAADFDVYDVYSLKVQHLGGTQEMFVRPFF